MGFFDKIFNKGPKEFSLKQIELHDFLEENAKDLLSEENKQIIATITKIESAKKELKEKIDALSGATLLNENIPEREKHIMEGNRQNYVEKLYSFIAGLKIEEGSYGWLSGFCKNYRESLPKLDTETAKAYFILKNFFEKEMLSCAASLKKLDDSVSLLSGIVENGRIVQFNDLFKKVRQLNESCVEKEKLDDELAKLENEVKESESKLSNVNEKVDLLKKGSEYHTHFKVISEREDIDNEIKKLNDNLNNSLKPLDKQFKKIAHDNIKPDLISSYLVLPLSTLENDSNYEILNVLTLAKQDIEKEDLKEKQKEKLQKQIESITKESLDLIKSNHARLKKEKETISELVEKSSILRDLKEHEYQIDHFNEKIKRQKKDLEDKKEKFSSIQTSQQIKKLEEELSEFSGYKISINE